MKIKEDKVSFELWRKIKGDLGTLKKELDRLHLPMPASCLMRFCRPPYWLKDCPSYAPCSQSGFDLYMHRARAARDVWTRNLKKCRRTRRIRSPSRRDKSIPDRVDRSSGSPRRLVVRQSSFRSMSVS